MRNYLEQIALGWFVLIIASCAGDKGDLNRVQPGYVAKADLVGGSWYYRRTVVDAPETMGPYASVGSGDLYTIERVYFVIQENYLVAYRDYSYVTNSEGPDNLGAPVVSFPIVEHFDIRREYRAETGEETNVIDENVTDRPWHQRAFMRVDWAQTIHPESGFDYFILPVDFIDTNGTQGGQFYVHENDVTNPYRARITPEKGFVDFVVTHEILPDWETCILTYDFSSANCGAGEIRVRHAFARVDQEKHAAYQMLSYPDSVPKLDASGNEILDPLTHEVQREPIFDRFGFYRLDRLQYDRQRGTTDSDRLLNILRFNIWKTSFDKNGSLIPYAEREIAPIVYYLNWDFPDELRATAQEVAFEWNRALQKTVGSLQNLPVEDFLCTHTASGLPDSNDVDCALPTVFILRDNSCNLTNLAAYFDKHAEVHKKTQNALGDVELTTGTLANFCAAAEYYSQNEDEPFVWQQNGDPRYNMLYWVSNITPADWSGYGPMLGDPTTGEIVSATAYLMGWTIDYRATEALEYIDYINGDLSLGDLLAGNNVPYLVSEGYYDPSTHTANVDEVQSKAKSTASSAYLEGLSNRFAQLGSGQQLVPLENGAHFDERLAKIQGTAFEAEWLTRPEDLMLASHGTWVPGAALSDDLLKQGSFLNRSQQISDKRQRTARFLEERTYCPLAELDGTLIGLAERLRGLSHDEKRQILRREIFRAVALHEVGHNLGLRHNFEASYDAVNYQPEFWQIEATGLSELDKQRALQPEYKYSSIMDYHGRFNARFSGLGAYDVAALKFGYGQLVETFANNVTGGALLKKWRYSNDYRKLPGHVGGADCSVLAAGAPRAACEQGNVDAMLARVDVPFDPQNPPVNEVPYLFCSDEYAGRTPTCRRFDFGANHREIMEANIVRYKNYFIFSNFLRNRLVLDFDRILSRGYNIFRDVVTTYQYMYLYQSHDANFLTATDEGADMAAAVAKGINLMTEVIAMPEPGTYFRCADDVDADGVMDPIEEFENPIYFPSFNIAYNPLENVDTGKGPDGELCDMNRGLGLSLGDSQPLFLGFTDEDFTTWTFSFLGTYWDKQAALRELADPTARFFRVNGVEDARTFSVSLYRLYQPEILEVLTNLIRYDRKKLASRLDEVMGPAVMPFHLVNPNLPLGNGVAIPTDVPAIYPGLARNLQRVGVVLGTALLTSPLDSSLDFAKYTRVTLRGSYDDFGTESDFQALLLAGDAAECTLPESGLTYRGRKGPESFNSGPTHFVGFEMVQDCATQVQALLDAETELAIKEAQLATDPTNPIFISERDKAETSRSAQKVRLARVQQMLQYIRLVHSIYEHGVGL